jgi:hypothetical protein
LFELPVVNPTRKFSTSIGGRFAAPHAMPGRMPANATTAANGQRPRRGCMMRVP